MVIVPENTKTGVMVLYKNCKENVKQKIQFTLFFSGKCEDTDTISASNAMIHPSSSWL